MEKVLSQSPEMKSEYCCSVVQVGQLTEIEGSNFLAKTNVLGTQIVVRKDQVHEGELMFYAANETALCEKFLSTNNMFEISCRDKNANADEVNAIMKEYDDNYRSKANELKLQAKNVKSTITSLDNSSKKIQKEIKKLEKSLESCPNEERSSIETQIQEKQAKVDAKIKKALSKTTEYTNLKNEIADLNKAGEPIVAEAKKHVGFFGKYGRVRCLTLRGEPSFGFLFGVKEMAKYCPGIESINLEDYLNQDFDTVNGELFVKAYVPPVKSIQGCGSKEGKRQKKANSFDRIVQGEFAFHYDTQNIERNMHVFSPQDVVTIDVKLHGTSICVGKLRVKEPKHIAPYKWLWNKFVDLTGMFQSTRFIDYNVVYGPVYSSRTVIKNRYINKEVSSGFYNSDVWSEWGDKIYPYLSEGMTIYGEIIGYITGSQKMIQKCYDYGCEEGTNKLMIYRITTTNSDGTKYEWNVPEVHEWTLKVIEKMKEEENPVAFQIHPIDILYHGTLQDLYPELDVENHWHKELLAKLQRDKEHFGMEENEPLCTHFTSPREGICIRKWNDPIKECFKCKTSSFKLGEAIRIDQGEVDIEMMDNYVNNGNAGNN